MNRQWSLKVTFLLVPFKPKYFNTFEEHKTREVSNCFLSRWLVSLISRNVSRGLNLDSLSVSGVQIYKRFPAGDPRTIRFRREGGASGGSKLVRQSATPLIKSWVRHCIICIAEEILEERRLHLRVSSK